MSEKPGVGSGRGKSLAGDSARDDLRSQEDGGFFFSIPLDWLLVKIEVVIWRFLKLLDGDERDKKRRLP